MFIMNILLRDLFVFIPIECNKGVIRSSDPYINFSCLYAY